MAPHFRIGVLGGLEAIFSTGGIRLGDCQCCKYRELKIRLGQPRTKAIDLWVTMMSEEVSVISLHFTNGDCVKCQTITNTSVWPVWAGQ